MDYGDNIQCSEEDFWIDRVDEMSIRCLTVSITTSIHNLRVLCLNSDGLDTQTEIEF